MPSRNFVVAKEKKVLGFKVLKDHLTLLLDGNAARDFN
jgi:hypothetical protein